MVKNALRTFAWVLLVGGSIGSTFASDTERRVVSADDAPSSRPRAIVLITVDSLRADVVPTLGSGRTRAPYLSALSWKGTSFVNAYAPSSATPATLASIFTGLYPYSHGVHAGSRSNSFGAVVGQRPLDSNFTTLTESLRAAGYTTLAAVSNPHLSDELGFAQGFDHFFVSDEPMPARMLNRYVYRLLRQAYGGRWQEPWKSRETFLWVHYSDPQMPYVAREPWMSKIAPEYAKSPEVYPSGLDAHKLRDLIPEPDRSSALRLRRVYESEVSFVDATLRELAASLGFAFPDVAMVVAGSHGEAFGEHGSLGSGADLYEELVRVPLIFRWIGGAGKSVVAEQPASVLDILPTVLAAAGRPPSFGAQGMSQLSVLRGGAEEAGRELLFQLAPQTWGGGRPLAGVLTGSWKLLRRQVGTRRLSREQIRRAIRVFNLEEDPQERRNLVFRSPERVAELEAVLRRALEALPEPPDRSGLRASASGWSSNDW